MIYTIERRHGSESSLQEAIDAFEALDESENLQALRRFLAERVQGIGLGESAVLADFLRDRTGLSQSAIQALIKEARYYRGDYGYLHTPKQVAEAYLKALCDHYQCVTWVGGSLYVYAASNPSATDQSGSSEHEDFHHRIDLGAVEKHLIEAFDDLPLLERKNARREVLTQLRFQCQDEDYFADAAAGVNLSDGFLRLNGAEGLELVPHSPAHKARMRIDRPYQPEASFGWLETAMARVLPDAESQAALQEVAGAVLFNVIPARDRARRMFILHGARNSGKSSIITMLESLLPADVVGSVPPEHWGDPNFRAGLEGLVLNSVTELGGATKIGGEHMKKIVSCERITVRRMYCDPVSITPVAWHLFATNELPRVLDKTDAFERRLLVITFPRSLRANEVDGDFADRLKADPSAILRWAAVGAARLQTNGGFTLPSAHRLATAKMQYGDDLPLLFGHTQLRANPGNRVTTSELRSALHAFARERDISPNTMHDGAIRKVAEIMQNRYGASRHKTNGQPFYQGVELISQPGPDVGEPQSTDLDDL